MGRYLTDTFTTASVGAFGTLDFVRTIPSNAIDIFKIKITPSIVASTSQLQIHSNSTRLSSERIYDSGAFAGATFYDPVEDNAGVYAERCEGFVARYYDTTQALSLFCRLINNDASPKTYDIVITYAVSAFAANIQSSPASIRASAYARGLDIVATVVAEKNSTTITEAEFRAILIAAGSALPQTEDLRTAAEGGTFTHNGTTQLIITGIVGNAEGAVYQWTSSAQGTWYFAWKVKNGTGWSRWTDGNEYPQYVFQTVVTNTTYDTGAPSGWQVALERGVVDNTFIVHATRPQTNGNIIQYWVAQIKDASSGSWRELDDNAGAAVTKYDGSGANHQYNPANFKFIAPVNWGTAAVGDLLLVDVSGVGTFTLSKCQWLLVNSVSGTDLTATGKYRPLMTAHLSGPIYDQVRVKVVKSPWAWTTEGFLGAEPNGGLWSPGFSDFSPQGFLNDVTSKDFVSAPIAVPAAVTNPEVRVWFENGYSRSDNSNTHSTGIIGGDGILGPTTWTSFTDPTWWVRVFSGTSAIATLNSNGTITFTTPGATALNRHGHWGVTNRARLMPDQNGEIQISASYTAVTFSDDGSHQVNNSIIGLGLEPIGDLEGGEMPFIYAQNFYDSGSLKLKIGLGYLYQYASYIRTIFTPAVMISMPATPFTIDFRMSLQESPTEKVFGIYAMEYQINGAGWTALSLPTMKVYLPGCVIAGLKAMCLFSLFGRMIGDTATLSSFSVIKGMIVGDAYQ